MLKRTTSNGIPGGTSRKVIQRIEEAFRQWDQDDNGIITRQELNQVLIALGGAFSEQDVNAIIQAADCDRDGQINYCDFIQWCFSGGAPYVVVQEFVPWGLKCFDGHELTEICPSVDGWCCYECGDDIEVNCRAVQCDHCNGLTWCYRCAVSLSAAGDQERTAQQQAQDRAAFVAQIEAEERVKKAAEQNNWRQKVRDLLMLWPTPERSFIEEVLAISVGLDEDDDVGGLDWLAVQRWLDDYLTPEDYAAAVELRHFVNEHKLEMLLPHVECGTITHVEQLRPGVGLEELAEKLPKESLVQLEAAGNAVVDATVEEHAESLEWDALVRDYIEQVPDIRHGELLEMLLSTMGLYIIENQRATPSTKDAALEAAVSRWLQRR